MASTFSAVMTPPTGVTATVLQAKSGKVYTPTDGTIIVTDEGDARDLAWQGWVTTSITRG